MVMCNKTPDSPGFVVYTWGRHVTMLKVYADGNNIFSPVYFFSNALSKCALNERKKNICKTCVILLLLIKSVNLFLMN
jgi:hypothetical protein